MTRVHDTEWILMKRQLTASLFREYYPRLSPVEEIDDSFPNRFIERETSPASIPITSTPVPRKPARKVPHSERASSLPDLIIERVPRRKECDESPQFYDKLEKKIRRYLERLNRGMDYVSDSDQSTFEIPDNNIGAPATFKNLKSDEINPDEQIELDIMYEIRKQNAKALAHKPDANMNAKNKMVITNREIEEPVNVESGLSNIPESNNQIATASDVYDLHEIELTGEEEFYEEEEYEVEEEYEEEETVESEEDIAEEVEEETSEEVEEKQTMDFLNGEQQLQASANTTPNTKNYNIFDLIYEIRQRNAQSQANLKPVEESDGDKIIEIVSGFNSKDNQAIKERVVSESSIRGCHEEEIQEITEFCRHEEELKNEVEKGNKEKSGSVQRNFNDKKDNTYRKSFNDETITDEVTEVDESSDYENQDDTSYEVHQIEVIAQVHKDYCKKTVEEPRLLQLDDITLQKSTSKPDHSPVFPVSAIALKKYAESTMIQDDEDLNIDSNNKINTVVRSSNVKGISLDISNISEIRKSSENMTVDEDNEGEENPGKCNVEKGAQSNNDSTNTTKSQSPTSPEIMRTASNLEPRNSIADLVISNSESIITRPNIVRYLEPIPEESSIHDNSSRRGTKRSSEASDSISRTKITWNDLKRDFVLSDPIVFNVCKCKRHS